MIKFITGLLLGMFLATWGIHGVFQFAENVMGIAKQEVEKVIMEHDGVLEVSVVGVPDERWGEVPKAFIVSREGVSVSEEEIVSFTRDRIAHFKAPKYVEFGELPKTATGKIQKYVLREKEWEGKENRIQGSSLT